MKARRGLVIALLLGGMALGAGPAASQPAMDFSSPQATLVTYFTLIAYGDLDVLAKVSTTPTTPQEKMMAEVGTNETIWVPHLIDAICDHFPKGQLDTLGDAATIRMKADPATTPAAGAEDMKIVFKKEGKDWKIVLKDSTMIPCFKDPTVKQIEFAQAMQNCYSDTAAEVMAGKYSAPVLASKAVDAKIKAVQQKYLHPTVVPPKNP